MPPLAVPLCASHKAFPPQRRTKRDPVGGCDAHSARQGSTLREGSAATCLEDNEIAALFTGVPKYLASRGRPGLSWAGSVVRQEHGTAVPPVAWDRAGPGSAVAVADDYGLVW